MHTKAIFQIKNYHQVESLHIYVCRFSPKRRIAFIYKRDAFIYSLV